MEVTKDDVTRILSASTESGYRTVVSVTVARRFRSMHYTSSKHICDCVVLNLVFNREITPTSADKFISMLRHDQRALYTNINSAYSSISEEFDEYAKEILKERFDEIKSLKMRPANYIVYIISLELKDNPLLNRAELIKKAYTYSERQSGKVPIN